MKMKTVLILFVFLLLSSTSISSKAQIEVKDNPKNFKLYLTEGLGVSYFKYDVRNFNHKIHGQSYRFVAPNIRIGIAAEKPVSKRLSLKTGLRIGMRIKRTSLL